MISFRFHIVSLTAIFLALAIGIGIGAGVVDRKTVDFLKGRVDDVSDRADRTSAENAELRADRDLWRRFGEQGGDAFVQGRLSAPVLLVGVRGIDAKPVDALRDILVAAGARVQGTVWFTDKLKLGDPDDVRALQAILGVASARPEVLRRATATRLAQGMAPDGVASSVLPALRSAGFVDFEAPSGEPVDLATVPAPESYFLVISAARPTLANDQVAIPFTTALAPLLPNRVLAADIGHPAAGKEPAEHGVFVGPLREDGDVNTRLSTIDNVEDLRGRVAAIYAMVALVQGKSGHFGVGSGAKRLVPEVAPAQ
jgi:hypothetical protein